MATSTSSGPPAGFVITRIAKGYGVAREGEILSVHATHGEAEAMIAALERHGPPPGNGRTRTPLRPS